MIILLKIFVYSKLSLIDDQSLFLNKLTHVMINLKICRSQNKFDSYTDMSVFAKHEKKFFLPKNQFFVKKHVKKILPPFLKFF